MGDAVGTTVEFKPPSHDGSSEQHAQERESSRHDVRTEPIHHLGPACPPVDAFHLIGENHSSDGPFAGNRNLEWVPLRLRRDRTHQREPNLAVVGGWRKYDARPAPGLFMAGLRREVEPDQIAAVGYRGPPPTNHQISRPRGESARSSL